MKLDYQPILNENNVTKWIDICAWCDVDKSITKKYMCEGYRASHGICEKHKDEVIKEFNEYNEKQGYIMGSDGFWIAPNNRMQHNPDYDI